LIESRVQVDARMYHETMREWDDDDYESISLYQSMRHILMVWHHDNLSGDDSARTPLHYAANGPVAKILIDAAAQVRNAIQSNALTRSNQATDSFIHSIRL